MRKKVLFSGIIIAFLSFSIFSAFGEEYTIKSGDTLYDIAVKNGLSLDKLCKSNGFDENHVIHPGDIISVPAKVVKKPQPVKQGNSVTVPKSSLSSRGIDLQANIVKIAYKYLKVPYVWGGTTPSGFDCSGFVQAVYALNGISLLRCADEQFAQEGTEVNREELQMGDLVFFTTYTSGVSHVGIYIGNDNFIHASSAAGFVTISSLNKDYYKKRFIGGKRYF